MLVLSRNRGEELVVVDNDTGERILCIKIVDIRGNKVRMGLTGGKRYGVHRHEVYGQIRESKVEVKHGETP